MKIKHRVVALLGMIGAGAAVVGGVPPRAVAAEGAQSHEDGWSAHEEDPLANATEHCVARTGGTCRDKTFYCEANREMLRNPSKEVTGSQGMCCWLHYHH